MVARRVLVVAAVTASALTPALRLASTRSNRCAALASTPDDDEDEDEYAGASQRQLQSVDVMNYQFDWVLRNEEAGELDLRPFYQRGFKWTQKQSSLWIESILRGYPCLPEIMLLAMVHHRFVALRRCRSCWSGFVGSSNVASVASTNASLRSLRAISSAAASVPGGETACCCVASPCTAANVLS